MRHGESSAYSRPGVLSASAALTGRFFFLLSKNKNYINMAQGEDGDAYGGAGRGDAHGLAAELESHRGGPTRQRPGCSRSTGRRCGGGSIYT